MIDSDTIRFSPPVLRGWKLSAEWEARRRIGKTNTSQARANTRAEAELKRVQRLRNDMMRAMLKSNEERLKRPPGQSRFWKFAQGEFVVHRLGDTLYPEFNDGPGISNWFKLETFDFYQNGIEGILNIRYALGSEHTRQWALLKDGEREGGFPPGFSVRKVFETGRIPWRNIRHFDPSGDNYYNCPHLHCLYADDGMPYESFGYYLISNDDSYEFELPNAHRVELDVLLAVSTGAQKAVPGAKKP